MKIYTKTGDGGETGLFGGDRVSKASSRVDAYGEVDELNSVLGVVRTTQLGKDAPDAFDALLATIQSRLFDVGAELANAKGKDLGIPLVDDSDITQMEQAIDKAEEEVPPLKTFVLPGGSRLAADLHVARTVCRRAERRICCSRSRAWRMFARVSMTCPGWVARNRDLFVAFFARACSPSMKPTAPSHRNPFSTFVHRA
jgi:cob(I)alamin adenosyltransferase